MLNRLKEATSHFDNKPLCEAFVPDSDQLSHCISATTRLDRELKLISVLSRSVRFQLTWAPRIRVVLALFDTSGLAQLKLRFAYIKALLQAVCSTTRLL